MVLSGVRRGQLQTRGRGMSQRFSKEVYRQSGPDEDPAKRTVEKVRGRKERSKLAWNYGVYFKVMRVLHWTIGVGIGIALIVAIIIKNSQ